MTKLVIWWLRRLPLAYRRRTVERILRAFGSSRSYATQVATSLN